MVGFTKKQHSIAITIGDQLRASRRTHNLSLRAISRALCIPIQRLEQLECDQFQAIPEEMYRELLLKTYATYIGLEWKSIKAQYDAQTLCFARTDRKSHRMALTQRHLVVAPHLIRTFLLGCAITGCFVYLAFLGYRAVSPPQLAIWSPAQDEWSALDRIVVRGKTQQEARLTINGEPIMIGYDGTFEQSVVLSEGLNVITVGASKKYSKERTEERRVLYRHGTARSSDFPPTLSN